MRAQSKKLRRLRITEFVEPCHFQKESPCFGYSDSFASNLQSRHPSSYPLLWPSSSPATKTMNAATSNAAKTHAPINNFFILNPFFRTCARFATRKNHRPSSRRTSSPAASSPPSRAAASASPSVFCFSQVPQSFPFCRVVYQICHAICRANCRGTCHFTFSSVKHIQ